ncbi:MAG: type II secretion system protein GspL [Candidatus Lernaella stagnicola]|nr:type II secretion system protein GspL [Candidatus Lernaella stagnicola]
MAHRILGIDIGHTEIKAVLAEVTWRATTVLGAYVERVPSAEEVQHRLLPTELEPETEPATDDESEGENSVRDGETDAPSEPPPPWVYAVGDMLKKHRLEFNEVHVTMPGTAVTTRIMTLPFSNRRRLEQVLPFELENHVPFDLDEMHVSFEVLDKDPQGGFRVLVVLTPNTELARYVGHIAAAGIDPKVIDVSPYTLFTAAKLALPDEMGAIALVDLGATHTDVAILNEGELVDLRSIPIGSQRFDHELARAMKKDLSEAEKTKIEKADLTAGGSGNDVLRRATGSLISRLRQTLQGVRTETGVEVTRIYLTGRGSLLLGLPHFLGEQLTVEVDRLNALASDLPVSIDAKDPADQGRYAAPLALVSRGLGELRDIKLNLRHGPFVYQRQQLALQSSIRSIAIVAGIVLVLLLYNVVAGHLQKKRQHEALQQQVVALYLKAFPGSVPPVRPLEQFKGQISKTVAKHKTVGFLGEDNLRAIDILKAMSEHIPPGVTVDIKKFDLTPEAIKIEGEVPSFPDVDRIEESLKKFSGFKSVKKETSSTVSEKVKFKFHIGLVQKKGGKSKTKKPAMTTPVVTP